MKAQGAKNKKDRIKNNENRIQEPGYRSWTAQSSRLKVKVKRRRSRDRTQDTGTRTKETGTKVKE
jgi:hypothetical protein